MRLSSRFPSVLFLLLLFKICKSENLSIKWNRKPLLDVLEYVQRFFQDYKINSKYTSRFPLLPPIIIVPVQEQIIYIQTVSGTKVSDQNANMREIMSHKLTSDSTSTNKDENDIEIFRDSSKTEKIKILNNQQNTSNNLKQMTTDETTIETTDISEEFSTMTPSTTSNMSESIMVQNSTLNGSYPNAVYKNDLVDSITLTNTIEDISLPPINDNRWQNFSSTKNSSSNDVIINTTEHVTGYPLPNTKGYTSAWYSNALIDQLSITTNSYTNNELPTSHKDDEWIHSVAGEFRPLAGLYYDGFLQTPLRKEEFIHRNNL
ncbi:uncharacterized protein LOC128674786 [Plodia interpunctella]|uniref:uncharacterized protein LOC128674786 n=1 Tax=Plodia interpunctella TaxID=58824 RepID=UPI0023678912|nr:uncharacterized protein LOC128674786 [Plodia interpunctella]